MAMDPPLSTVQQLMGVPEDLERIIHAPTRSCDTEATASTPVDVFIVDIPGLKPNDIKVQVEVENVLNISGERKRTEKEEGEVKYIRMERRVAKFTRKFTLPADCNLEASFAVFQDGVLIVTIPKLPPPDRKKPKTPVDVKEYPNSYVFKVDMPGLKSNDIKVQVEDENVLNISGERKRTEKEEGEVKYIRMERRVAKFTRKFTLPADCNLEAISAAISYGVLTVTVPKLPQLQPKKYKRD